MVVSPAHPAQRKAAGRMIAERPTVLMMCGGVKAVQLFAVSQNRFTLFPEWF